MELLCVFANPFWDSAPRADLRVLSLVIMLRCERMRAGMHRINVQTLNTHVAKVTKLGMKAFACVDGLARSQKQADSRRNACRIAADHFAVYLPRVGTIHQEATLFFARSG